MRVPEWLRVGTRALTDDEGRYEVELTPPDGVSPHARPILRAEARASAEGYVFGSSARPVAEAADGVLRLDPVVAEGPQWSGRLLDADGEPVAGMGVEFLDPSAGPWRVTTWSDGRFFVVPRRAGTYWVRAHEGGAGWIQVGPLSLEVDRGHDFGDLVLADVAHARRPGDHARWPAPGRDLGSIGSGGWFEPCVRLWRRHRPGGRCSPRARTDEGGRFVLRGPARGEPSAPGHRAPRGVPGPGARGGGRGLQRADRRSLPPASDRDRPAGAGPARRLDHARQPGRRG